MQDEVHGEVRLFPRPWTPSNANVLTLRLRLTLSQARVQHQQSRSLPDRRRTPKDVIVRKEAVRMLAAI
jgi:hypothetical protein